MQSSKSQTGHSQSTQRRAHDLATTTPAGSRSVDGPSPLPKLASGRTSQKTVGTFEALTMSMSAISRRANFSILNATQHCSMISRSAITPSDIRAARRRLSLHPNLAADDS